MRASKTKPVAEVKPVVKARGRNADSVLSIKAKPRADMKAFLADAQAIAGEAKKANEKVSGLYPKFAVQACFDYGCTVLRKSGAIYAAFKHAFDRFQNIVGVTDPAARSKNLFRVLTLIDQWAKVNKPAAYKKVYVEATDLQREKMEKRAQYNPNKKKETVPFNPMHEPRKNAAKLAAQMYGKAYKYAAMTKKNDAVSDVWLDLQTLAKEMAKKFDEKIDLSAYEKE